MKRMEKGYLIMLDFCSAPPLPPIPLIKPRKNRNKKLKKNKYPFNGSLRRKKLIFSVLFRGARGVGWTFPLRFPPFYPKTLWPSKKL